MDRSCPRIFQDDGSHDDEGLSEQIRDKIRTSGYWHLRLEDQSLYSHLAPHLHAL